MIHYKQQIPVVLEGEEINFITDVFKSEGCEFTPNVRDAVVATAWCSRQADAFWIHSELYGKENGQ